MKESNELLNLLSNVNNKQELTGIIAKVEEFETYMKENGMEPKKRQLIISQAERFLSFQGGSSF